MRTIFTLLLVIYFTHPPIYSQNIKGRLQFVPESEVPITVVSQQERLFPTNYVYEWQVQEMDRMQNAPTLRYIAIFEEDGRPGFSASYLPDGFLIFNSEFMPSENILSVVRLKINRNYKDYTIHAAEFVTLHNPKREIYLIKLLENTRQQHVFFDTLGNEIGKQSLPVEVLLLLN